MTGDVQDSAKLTAFRTVALLFIAAWAAWGVEIVRGTPNGPAAVAAVVLGMSFFVVIRWSAAARSAERRTDRWTAAHAWIDALRWAVWIAWVAYLAWALLLSGEGISWTVMLWLTLASTTLAVVEPLLRRRATAPAQA
jgi:hypothetical protein